MLSLAPDALSVLCSIFSSWKNSLAEIYCSLGWSGEHTHGSQVKLIQRTCCQLQPWRKADCSVLQTSGFRDGSSLQLTVCRTAGFVLGRGFPCSWAGMKSQVMESSFLYTWYGWDVEKREGVEISSG